MAAASAGLCGLLLPPRFAAAQGASADQPVGQILRLVGPVFVRTGDVLAQAAVGTTVRLGSRIVTESGGRAEIELADGSRLTIGDDSEVVMANFVRQPGSNREAIIDLLKGILRAVVPSGTRWDRFEIRAATAIASVRSTDWIVESTADKSAVFVVDGVVAVSDRNRTAEVLLEPGFGTDIPAGGTPSAPVRWRQPRIDAAMARLAIN